MITNQIKRNQLIVDSLPIVRRIARRFNRQMAEDIVQEFALKFDSYFLANYREGGGQSWLTFLTHRMRFFCLDFAKRRDNQPVANYRARSGTRIQATSIHTVIDRESSQTLTIADLLSKDYQCESNQRRSLHRLVATLPERSRRIFELKYVDGWSAKAIADRLGLDPSTVSKIHAAGLAQLRAEH